MARSLKSINQSSKESAAVVEQAPETTTDIKVVACNYQVATSIFPNGARAYVRLLNPGGGNDRIYIIGRSHGGRWVTKWEAIKRLGDFRIKTLPQEHPLYDRAKREYWREGTPEIVRWLIDSHDRVMEGAR